MARRLVLCTFHNSTHKDLERLVFQCAVPKYVQMEMKPATSATVPANNAGHAPAVTQTIRVKNSVPSKPLMMRLKIQYTVGGRQIEEQAQVNSFPAL